MESDNSSSEDNPKSIQFKWVGRGKKIGTKTYYTEVDLTMENEVSRFAIGDTILFINDNNKHCLGKITQLFEETEDQSLHFSAKIFLLPEDTKQGRMKFHHENEVFMSDEGEKDYKLSSLRGKYEGIVLDATTEDNKDEITGKITRDEVLTKYPFFICRQVYNNKKRQLEPATSEQLAPYGEGILFDDYPERLKAKLKNEPNKKQKTSNDIITTNKKKEEIEKEKPKDEKHKDDKEKEKAKKSSKEKSKKTSKEKTKKIIKKIDYNDEDLVDTVQKEKADKENHVSKLYTEIRDSFRCRVLRDYEIYVEDTGKLIKLIDLPNESKVVVAKGNLVKIKEKEDWETAEDVCCVISAPLDEYNFEVIMETKKVDLWVATAKGVWYQLMRPTLKYKPYMTEMLERWGLIQEVMESLSSKKDNFKDVVSKMKFFKEKDLLREGDFILKLLSGWQLTDYLFYKQLKKKADEPISSDEESESSSSSEEEEKESIQQEKEDEENSEKIPDKESSEENSSNKKSYVSRRKRKSSDNNNNNVVVVVEPNDLQCDYCSLTVDRDDYLSHLIDHKKTLHNSLGSQNQMELAIQRYKDQGLLRSTVEFEDDQLIQVLD